MTSIKMMLMFAAHATATPDHHCVSPIDPGRGNSVECWGGCSTTPIFGCGCDFITVGSHCHLEDLKYSSHDGCALGGCKEACRVTCDAPKTTTTTTTPSCSATDTDGDWIAREVIQGATTYSISIGTQKQHSQSNTASWSSSVTKSAGANFKFASAGVDSNVAQTTANEYAGLWSVSTTADYSVNFGAEDVGKQLWQYIIHIQDDCSHSETTFTRDYALTQGVWEKPCCPAGWGAPPNHTTDYQACHAPAEKASWCSTTAEYFTAV